MNKIKRMTKEELMFELNTTSAKLNGLEPVERKETMKYLKQLIKEYNRRKYGLWVMVDSSIWR